MLRHRLDRRDYPDTTKLELARRLRRDPMPAERSAWSLLRNHKILGLKFRRQHVLCGFIVDFYCPRLRLVLELDGAPHDHAARAGYDAARTAHFEARGYRVLRVRNRELSRKRLEQLLRPLLHRPSSPLSRQGEGDRG
ncbi:MAG: cytosine methyltransferase [Gemmatimonadetes bacterium]|nr:MAG: cytosine methyltransferase [Gemmatimonadota bacterium]